MKKYWLIIGALVALLAWREHYHAQQTASICAAQVADAVQVATDEILSQF
jgi:hypothetical protein